MDEKTKKFQEKLDTIRGKKFTVLGNYVNNSTKVKIKCNECGYEWSPMPMTLTRSNKPTGCPQCSNNVKGTTESFKEVVKN